MIERLDVGMRHVLTSTAEINVKLGTVLYGKVSSGVVLLGLMNGD